MIILKIKAMSWELITELHDILDRLYFDRSASIVFFFLDFS